MKILTFPKIEGLSYPVGQHVILWTEYIENVIPILKKILTFPAFNLWCRGSSGSILAGMVAIKMRNKYEITINHIKKEGESSHHGNHFEANKYQNIIIDDFSRYGATVNDIISKMGTRELDAIILNDTLPDLWRFKKTPEYLIVSDEENSYNREWNSLTPTKFIKNENAIINFHASIPL